MREVARRTRLLITMGGMFFIALTGCQIWQTTSSIAGLGTSSKERQIVKQAMNDPFPSPDQVGVESE